MKEAQTKKVQSLFDSISGSYDKLNHLLSLGIDKRWRRKALEWITDGPAEKAVLDVACGTGDFSIEIAKHSGEDTRITAIDISNVMLDIMRQKVLSAGLEKRISIEDGNCEQMHFADNSFDRVTIAFGIRNFENREKALEEVLRVMKKEGRLVVLELSMPSGPIIFKRLYHLYFTRILPLIGGWISGNKAAYKYLPESVLAFPDKEKWKAIMRGCGFRNVTHIPLSSGICRMYLGEK